MLCRLFLALDEDSLKKLTWEDGSLVILLEFKLFFGKPAVMTNKVTNFLKEVAAFEKMELENLSKWMISKLDRSGKPETVKIMKIVTKDKNEFNVDLAILAKYSLVFKAILNLSNIIEGQQSSGSSGGYGSGRTLVMEDLSGKTVKVLLHYFYGGVLLKEDWRAEDVILELTWAARKYALENLSVFLDKVLPEIPFSSSDVMAKLAVLTKTLGMTNAEKGLLSKLKEIGVNIDE